ncbi:MAG: GrpB family protein [Actinomycetota bacterium]
MSGSPLTIVDHDPSWPERFVLAGASLRAVVGDDSGRVDHIGSTSVPGLAAKDVIDIQITVAELDVADAWPDELLPGLVRRSDIVTDHVPAGSAGDPADWAKRYWSNGADLHVHVRAAGRANQRYPLLFRDYLRADRLAADSYAAIKRALTSAAPGDWDTYYDVKDPACDLIIAGAEHWAARVGWTQPASDA